MAVIEYAVPGNCVPPKLTCLRDDGRAWHLNSGSLDGVMRYSAASPSRRGTRVLKHHHTDAAPLPKVRTRPLA